MGHDALPHVMKKDWKYYLGIGLLIYSFLPYVSMAIIPFLGFRAATVGAFMVIFVSSGEIGFLVSVALLGKAFMGALRQRLLRMVRPAHEPRPISFQRHCLGMSLLAVSFLPHYIVLIDLLFFSHRENVLIWLVWLMAGGEVLFMAALFVLGAPFWDRLRDLPRWRSEIGIERM